MPNKKKSNNKKTGLSKDIERLYDTMLDNDLYELTFEEKGGSKLVLKRGAEVQEIEVKRHKPEKMKEEEQAQVNDDKDYIFSPMNGVFYSSPSPGAEPFVKKGSKILAGNTICIIEAMKLMNEVQVERNCTIKKVLVKNSEAVKVNQRLFEVKNN